MSDLQQPMLEAANWLIEHERPLSDKRQQTFERWLQDTENRQAWQKIQALQNQLACLKQPGLQQAAAEGLRQADKVSRRQVLMALAGLAGVGWFSYQMAPVAKRQWRVAKADYAAEIGSERFDLTDHSQLWLNSHSRVENHYDANIRRLGLLRGEVYIATHPDPRPFELLTRLDGQQVKLQPLGTEFSVRMEPDGLLLRVHAGRVQLIYASANRIVESGQQCRIQDRRLLQNTPLAVGQDLWREGLYQADAASLMQLKKELSRHHSQVLLLSSRVEKMSITGMLPVHDLDACLQTIQDTLPVRIRRLPGIVVIS